MLEDGRKKKSQGKMRPEKPAGPKWGNGVYCGVRTPSVLPCSLAAIADCL